MQEYNFEEIDDICETPSDVDFDNLISSKNAIDLEKDKFLFGKNQIRLIYKQQQKWMEKFFTLSMAVLIVSIIVLIAMINGELSDTAIATVFVGVIIEVIALFSIMVKYTFSSHTNEFVQGIYKHNHYTHNNAVGETDNKWI